MHTSDSPTSLETTLFYTFIAVSCLLATIIAFFYQLYYHSLPCPLCLLQRFGFLAIGFGAVSSLKYNSSLKADLIIILASLFTLTVGVRQVLLHIAPHDPGFGTSFLGLHFYTWSSILSFYFILLMALAPFLSKMLTNITLPNINLLINTLQIAFIATAFAEVVSTFLECGFTYCPEDPVIYEGLKGWRK